MAQQQSNFNSQAQNPMSEYLLKLQLIVSNTEFKNKALAQQYETMESHIQGDKYVSAKTGKDIFESYEYDSRDVYNYLASKGYDEPKIFFLIQHPQMIPQKYKDELMIEAREKFIASYQEQNRYYLMLNGLPFPGSDTEVAEEEVLIPEGFYEMYEADGVIYRDQPIHTMPKKYQELFMNTTWYTQCLEEHPSAEYLKHIGSNSIPYEISRPASDGSILLTNTSKLSTFHPIFGNVSVSYDIVHKFTSVYKETRNYVYQTLRGDFSEIYPNYDSFIRFLAIYLSIGNCMNEFLKLSGSYIHMNNVTANNLFSLYGLPSVIMEGTSMIEFLKKFRLILMDKGTNKVYRVKDLIGYQNTDIYTLVMVKQQVFENGIPIYTYDENHNKIPKTRIVFRRIGTTDDDVSYFKFRESTKEYPYEEIRDADPRWWNTREVEDMIHEMNYTLSNSKYIQLSTHLSMTDIWWQCVILLRGLLDNKIETKNTQLNINYNINGSSSMSLFDAILSLIIMMNWQTVDFKGDPFHGELYIPNTQSLGRDDCVDMLYNGTQNAARYERSTGYAQGQIIGLQEYYETQRYDEKGNLVTERNVRLWNGTWYIAKHDFTSFNPSSQGGPSSDPAAMQAELARGTIEVYGDESVLTPGKANDLMLGGPYKIASFNFNIKDEDPEFYKSISNMTYLSPDVFVPMLDRVVERESINIADVLMNDVKLIQNYLSTKLRRARTILDYRQTSKVYSKLFLVDPVRDWFDNSEFNINDQLMSDYELSSNELLSFYRYFNPFPVDENDHEKPDLVVNWEGKDYNVYLYNVLNKQVSLIEINDEHPFTDRSFIEAFVNALDMSNNIQNIEGSSLSDNIKNNGTWKEIIKSKVWYDYGNADGYPRTFQDLLMRTNSSLYSFLMNTKAEGNVDSIVTFMRAIIKALESYSGSSLAGLEFKALGINNYFYILKEVISYFKSYMVEFTSEEFTYIFDGIFDNGGRPNMIKLIDEITSGGFEVMPHDTAALYDVSCAKATAGMRDDNSELLHDEGIFRLRAAYSTLLASGYDIWYDDGKRITKQAPTIDPTTEVVANIVSEVVNGSLQYKLIINTLYMDIIPANYYGNVR